MASKIDVFNMALFHIGSSSKVASDTEASMERIACSTFYDTTLDALLAYKSTDWGFALKSVVLADLGEPPTNWQFRYAYPNDCVRAIGLVIPGNRTPSEAEQIPYQLQQGDNGQTLVTDQPEAELQYISRGLPAERFPAAFIEALALRLAAFIAMPLKKDADLAGDLAERAELAIQSAMANSLNQRQPDAEPVSDYIQEMHA